MMISTSPVAVAPNASASEIQAIFKSMTQRQYAVRRSTAKERIRKLQRFHDCVYRRRAEVEAAIWKDFRKSQTETIISELGVVLGETRFAIRHLKSWMQTQSVGTPMAIFGSSSEIMVEPKGVCLIISPWNYPFNLSFAPLVSAVAAGNCVVIKPSEYTVHCSALIKSIVAECFDPEEVSVLEGDATVAQALLDMPFNHVFFTGSPAVGKLVMAAAARHLASVTLELGGKSPVVVDESANLEQAASKIAWLKAMNAGQICIAPDYILVQEGVKDQLIERIAHYWKKYYGEDTATRQASPDLCRLVNSRHFERVKNLLDDALANGAQLAFGGHTDASENYIEPTLLTHVTPAAAIHTAEIFGPLLPVYTYEEQAEALRVINEGPKPLALYIFSNRTKAVNEILRETRSGGVTVNDCGPHFYNSELPFGGANNSGIGRSHGHFGFLEFSHQRSIVRQTRIFPTTDLMLPPYGGRLAKVLLHGILRWF